MNDLISANRLLKACRTHGGRPPSLLIKACLWLRAKSPLWLSNLSAGYLHWILTHSSLGLSKHIIVRPVGLLRFSMLLVLILISCGAGCLTLCPLYMICLLVRDWSRNLRGRWLRPTLKTWTGITLRGLIRLHAFIHFEISVVSFCNRYFRFVLEYTNLCYIYILIWIKRLLIKIRSNRK